MRADPKADQMAVLVLDVSDPGIQLFPGVQRVQCPVVEELPGEGQTEGSAAALKKFNSQFLLQILNAQRKRRLGYEELPGGFCDALLLGSSDNVLQLVPVHRAVPRRME